MTENKVFRSKQRINNEICRCQGMRMNLNDQMGNYFDSLLSAVYEMERRGAEDFKIGDHALGVRQEIESILRFFNSWSGHFQGLLERYENIEEGNKEWKSLHTQSYAEEQLEWAKRKKES